MTYYLSVFLISVEIGERDKDVERQAASHKFIKETDGFSRKNCVSVLVLFN